MEAPPQRQMGEKEWNELRDAAFEKAVASYKEEAESILRESFQLGERLTEGLEEDRLRMEELLYRLYRKMK